MQTETLRQTVLLVAGAVVLPYFVLVLAHAVQRRRLPYGNAMLMPALLVGVAMLLLSQRIGPALDAAVGQANLSWAMGYGVGAVGFYFAGLFAWRVGPRQLSPWVGVWLRGGLYVALAGIAAVYVLHLRAAPEWPSRIPRNWQEALLGSFFFLYCGAVSLLALDAAAWTIANEENEGAAQRALFALLGGTAALVCFVGKTGFVWLHTAGYDVGWLDRAALWAMAVATLGLLGAVLPQTLHNRLAAHPPVRTWRTLADLRRLERLHGEIRSVQPSVTRTAWEPWWRQLLRADEALYQMVIAIHDAKRALAALPADTGASMQRQVLLTRLAVLDRLDERGYADTLRALRTAAQELERQSMQGDCQERPGATG